MSSERAVQGSLWQGAIATVALPAAIVLSQYNILQGGYAALESVVNPLWTSTATSVATFFGLAFLFRSANKAMLITLAANVCFFDLALVICLKKAFSSIDVVQFGANTLSIGVVVALLVFSFKGDLSRVSRFAAYVVIFALIVQIQIIAYRQIVFSLEIWPRVHWQTITAEMAVPPSLPVQKPDIYYIIVDTMPSQEVVERTYDYHDKTFDEYLKQKGFYVAEQSHSNYPITMMSLSSSLNMTLLDGIANLMNAKEYAYDMTRFLIQNSRVALFLKENGYTFVNAGSGLGNTNFMLQANLNLRSSFWDEQFIPTLSGTLLGWPNQCRYIREYLRKVRLDCFDKLAASRSQGHPKVVFCHIICPHVPCLFDANGGPVVSAITYNQLPSERQLFLNQIIFCRRKLMQAVDAILQEPGPKPIIIIQGDHGSANSGNCQLPSKGWSDKLIHERFGILNAYYLPNHESIGLYPTITPVNSFRLIFNHYLGTNIPLEKDRNFATDPAEPFVFREVTDIVRGSKSDPEQSTAKKTSVDSVPGTIDGDLD